MDQMEQRQEREEDIQHHDAEERVTEQQPVQTEAEPQREHAEASSPRSDDKEEEPVPVLPRRSTRERRKPDRLNPQEYVLAQQQQQQEWMKKCDYLNRLKSSTEMKSYEKEIVQTMLDILKRN